MGISSHYLYQRAKSAKARCTNPNNKHYADYGGRGITFDFHSPTDMFMYLLTLEGHDDRSLSIDRIDNDGPYARGNLRFASASQQLYNQRRHIDGPDRDLTEEERAEVRSFRSNYGSMTTWLADRYGVTCHTIDAALKDL